MTTDSTGPRTVDELLGELPMLTRDELAAVSAVARAAAAAGDADPALGSAVEKIDAAMRAVYRLTRDDRYRVAVLRRRGVPVIR